jgi:hypothetical protein
MKKRGQVTIFIIAGIFLVIFAFLIYFFYPRIASTFTQTSKSPFDQMKECIEPTLEESVKTLLKQGGSMNPELYYEYNGEKISYLCYTVEDYKTCVVQKPILINSFQNEIRREISKASDECLNRLVESYEKKGYKVKLRKAPMEVEIVPNYIVLKYDHTLELEKVDKEVYSGFNLKYKSQLYDLLMIAGSILDFEVYYGDSEITSYMDYYRDIKVEKNRRAEGTKIYNVENTETKERLSFATRSLAWPAGY